MRLRVVLLTTLLVAIASHFAYPAEATAPHTLFVTGQTAADGFPLFGLRELRGGGGRLTFTGETEAVVLFANGSGRVLARTGDPMPLAGGGTLAHVRAVAITPDGRGLFAAEITAATTSRTIFLADGDVLVPLAEDVSRLRSFAANSRLDLVLRSGTRRLEFRAAGDGTFTSLPFDRGTFLALRTDPVVSDDGAVAFTAALRRPRRAGVFRWTAATGLEQLVDTADGSLSKSDQRALERAPVAVNATGDLAYFGEAQSVLGIFVRTADGTTRRVVRSGDATANGPLERIVPRFLGIDEAGHIAFLGQLGGQSHVVIADGESVRALTPAPEDAVFAPRLASAGVVAWVAEGALHRYRGGVERLAGPADGALVGTGFAAATPALAETGAVIAQMRRHAIYDLGGRTVHPLVATGHDIAGAGLVVQIGPHVVGPRGEIAFSATVADGRDVLAILEPDGAYSVLATGDPVPGDDDAIVDVDPASTIFDVRGDRVVASVYTSDDLRILLARAGTVTDVVGPRKPRSKRLTPSGPVLALRRGVLLDAVFGRGDAGRSGLVHRTRRTRPVALIGTRLPGSRGSVTGIGRFAPTEAGVVFEAQLDDPSDPLVLVAWRPGRGLRRIDPPPWREAGTVTAWAIASDGRDVVVLSPLPGDETRTALTLVRHRDVERLVTDGDGTSGGDTIRLGTYHGGPVLRSGSVVFAGILGDTAQVAILEVPTPSRPPRRAGKR